MMGKNPSNRQEGSSLQVGCGNLHLWFPWARSLDRLTSTLKTFSCQYKDEEDKLVIAIQPKDLLSVILLLMNLFSTEDQMDIKVLFQPDSKQPEPANRSYQVDSLYSFLIFLQECWLKELFLQEGKLSAVFQPIFYADNLSRVYGLECLLRGMENQQTIYPGLMLEIARNTNQVEDLDLVARQVAISEAKKHNVQTKIFINFIPTAIYQPQTCLHSTASLVRAVGLQPSQVVFEVIESQQVKDMEHLKGVLAHYRKAGFSVALDDFGTGYSSLKVLNDLRPDYVKLSMELTRHIHQDNYKQILVEKTIETTRALGIKLIAEGVECQEECEWLVEHGADYLQGYYLAKPSPLPFGVN